MTWKPPLWVCCMATHRAGVANVLGSGPLLYYWGPLLGSMLMAPVCVPRTTGYIVFVQPRPACMHHCEVARFWVHGCRRNSPASSSSRLRGAWLRIAVRWRCTRISGLLGTCCAMMSEPYCSLAGTAARRALPHGIHGLCCSVNHFAGNVLCVLSLALAMQAPSTQAGGRAHGHVHMCVHEHFSIAMSHGWLGH